jgi:predicted transcriptional regulator
MTDEIALTPEQIADLKRQLQAANDRLLAVERRRKELQAYIDTLTNKLKRAESRSE